MEISIIFQIFYFDGFPQRDRAVPVAPGRDQLHLHDGQLATVVVRPAPWPGGHGEGQETSPQQEESRPDVDDGGPHLLPLLAALPPLLHCQHVEARHQQLQIHQPHLPPLALARHEQQLLQPLHILPVQLRVQTRPELPPVVAPLPCDEGGQPGGDSQHKPTQSTSLRTLMTHI